MGIKAAELVKENRYGMMTALKGDEVTAVPLSEAVSRLKTVTKEWLELADILL